MDMLVSVEFIFKSKIYANNCLYVTNVKTKLSFYSTEIEFKKSELFFKFGDHF